MPQLATFTYNGTTGLLSSINRGSGTTLSLAPAAAYGLATSPAAGANPTAVITDALSNLTTYTLDGQGRTTKLQTPDGGVTTYTLDAAGHVIVLADPLDRVTTFTYGTGAAADNLLQVTNPDNSNEYFAYDATFHEVTQVTDTLGNITTYTLDGTGDVTSMEDAKGEVTTYAWSSGLLQERNHATQRNNNFSVRCIAQADNDHRRASRHHNLHLRFVRKPVDYQERARQHHDDDV